MNKIFLGYMGCGKTTLAKYVAKLVNYNVIDLDRFIEKEENKTIEEIFKNYGEIYFRKVEGHYLKEVLSTSTKTIVSLGGGTPCYSNNIDIIKKYSTSFYFKATAATLYKRLIKEKYKRPLIAKIEDSKLQEFIAIHLLERSAYYEKADYTITIDDKNIVDISDEIIKLLL